MFCEEEIINAYRGQPNHGEKGDYYLDHYFDMALHITENHRLVLETENYFLSVETGGVYKIPKTGPVETIAREDEWLESYCHYFDDEPKDDPEDDFDYNPWIEYEYTLFAGEKIRSVEEQKDFYRVLFSDFTLTVIPYPDDEEVPRYNPAPFSRVLGTEHLIKKCSCGGTGILDIDIVGDFGVRCDKCHKGTYATPMAYEAIREWNEEKNLLMIPDYPKETFEKYRGKDICYIAIDDRYSRFKNQNVFSFPFICQDIIVEIEGRKFCIGSGYCGQGMDDFTIDEYTDFNTEMWPYKIEAQNGKIRLVKEDRIDGKKQMIFDVDGEKLTVISEEDHLIIEKPDAVEVQRINGKDQWIFDADEEKPDAVEVHSWDEK